jgi:hypothetical protein
MTFFRIFQHLLPNARAWTVLVNKKLRQFFEGLSGLGADVKTFLDLVWLDIDPQSTRELTRWEVQFGLPDTGLSEQQRRDRLDATWKALGGQDPEYLQSTLRGNGFDVFIHEWWVPGTEPAPGVKLCVTPRNPLLVLRREFTGADLKVDCGEALAACGEAFAEAGNGVEPVGYPLVNKIFQTVKGFTAACGESGVEAGESGVECGEYVDFVQSIKNYIVPNDPAKWPYFLYIGGPTFGDIAQVDPKRRDEFEALCLKICPAQQWLGILVEYV